MKARTVVAGGAQKGVAVGVGDPVTDDVADDDGVPVTLGVDVSDDVAVRLEVWLTDMVLLGVAPCDWDTDLQRGQK